LQELCFTLDQVYFKSAAVVDLLYALTLQIFGGANLRLDGSVLRLNYQDAVIKLTDFSR
jgi:hypothetical protein